MKSILFAGLVLLTCSTAPVFAGDAAMTPTEVSAAASQITISEYMFAPDALEISAGTKVTWVNHDDVPHTIVDASPNKTFRSSALDTNDSYSFTFTKPGTYHYFCTLHPKMVGTINVTAAK